VHRGRTGEYVTTSVVGGETVRAFIPRALPPVPPLAIDPELRDRLDEALLAMGRLDSVAVLVPDVHLFLYPYVRKEAVLSSQIEGTQSSLSDLLLYEAKELPGVPQADVVEVSNYARALEHGVKRIRGGFPLSGRLIREIHGILLARGRGATKERGEYRRSQNWIGGSRPGNAHFVPPPAAEVTECMGALEKWLHDEPERTPAVLKAALGHVQFETIHPFLDGNGRVGRLLITLILCNEGVLREPLLYLSLYLKQHRARYYELLDLVRAEGEWEEWVAFFAEGVHAAASEAVVTAQRLVELFEADRDRVQGLGRIAGSALRVQRELERRPYASVGRVAARTKLSIPTVGKALTALERLGIAREITGMRRGRVYVYDSYMRLLAPGTEPPAAA
jgi:Fic family protein